jgi:hypothetical protein
LLWMLTSSRSLVSDHFSQGCFCLLNQTLKILSLLFIQDFLLLQSKKDF